MSVNNGKKQRPQRHTATQELCQTTIPLEVQCGHDTYWLPYADANVLRSHRKVSNCQENQHITCPGSTLTWQWPNPNRDLKSLLQQSEFILCCWMQKTKRFLYFSQRVILYTTLKSSLPPSQWLSNPRHSSEHLLKEQNHFMGRKKNQCIS